MIMINTHALLAGVAGCPELKMSRDEGKQLAEAYAQVSRHYNWAVNEKSADWYNLITCVGAIYGSKLFAIKLRRDMEQADARKKAPVFNQPQRVATPSAPQASHVQASAPSAPSTAAHAAGVHLAPAPKQNPVLAMPAAEPDMSEDMD